MKLNDNDFKLLCNEAEKAAIKAGKFVFNFDRDILKSFSKKTGSSRASKIVTEVDFKSQEIILEILNPTLSLYDLALLTEETEDDSLRLVKDYFWCIDPLDGTLPFSEGENGYSVSIALVERSGQSVIGVVYDPVKNNLYKGIIGHGAWKNSNKIKTAKINNYLSFNFDRSFFNDNVFDDKKQKLKKIGKRLGYDGININYKGGAVINSLDLIDNLPGGYFKEIKEKPGGGSLWDFAATLVIMEEAGFFVSDIKGFPLNLNNKETTFLNESGILYVTSKEIQNLIIEYFGN